MWREAFGRPPEAEEETIVLALVADHRRQFKADPEDARGLVSVGRSPAHADLDVVEWAVWTSAGRVILNLDELVTRY